MQSLDLLNHVSDYGERMMQLDGLRNRLEALASPSLVSAISGADAVKTAVMVQVLICLVLQGLHKVMDDKRKQVIVFPIGVQQYG